MWSQFITVTVLMTIVFGLELPGGPPGFHRIVSPGVRSLGYKMVYGDQDMSAINEVIKHTEKKNAMKPTFKLNEALAPLPAQDVKCLMSSTGYCSVEMKAMKTVLIRAIKDNCTGCTKVERQKAGKVMASMMAHDPVAWKHFLTRYAVLILHETHKEPKAIKQLKLREVGMPEEVLRSAVNRYIMPGVNVRVKRFPSELVA